MSNDLFILQLNGDEPVYRQLIRHYKILLVTGKIYDGFELPSRRELAVKLVINPNTVQRAYAELENEGLIYTQNNVKSVAIADERIIKKLKEELIAEFIKDFDQKISTIVHSQSEIVGLLQKYWYKE